MEISFFQVLKYFVYDFHRFKSYRLRFIWENKRLFDQNLAVFQESQFSPYVMDLPLDEITFTVFDLETTGFFPKIGDDVIAIGAMKINLKNMKFPEHFYEIIKPFKEPSEDVLELTGLTRDEVKNGKSFPDAFANFLLFSHNTVLVAHPASFDVPFLQIQAKRWGFPNYSPKYIDSYEMAQVLYPHENQSLDDLLSRFEIEKKNRHHALHDADMTAKLFQKFVVELKKHGIFTYSDWDKAMKNRKKVIRRRRPNHV
ncbi:PolC-type DNA polymerase III [Evansella tamaricis]|uniref:3'-5' exoribonuclease n=1 Tax=Evansella tamaricis TaxID=2069301 RepID=A0ABS6JMF6_9BACI|nr:exonuclease domain-containing protein [Evansella tamaricis]MBU9714846.1 3'-5' exoribonuclease [Evansella tamaricis]